MKVKQDQFTESTKKLLFRLELSLNHNIEAKKRDLKLYKELGDQPENHHLIELHELVELAEEKLTQLKADLEQLKNL
jgi:hypothetical protein